jgi:hypothetical protein
LTPFVTMPPCPALPRIAPQLSALVLSKLLSILPHMCIQMVVRRVSSIQLLAALLTLLFSHFTAPHSARPAAVSAGAEQAAVQP